MSVRKAGSDRSLTGDEIKDFTLQSFTKSKESGSIASLVHFHSINKFLLLARSPADVAILGRLVANKDHGGAARVFEDYGAALVKILGKSPTTKTHYNALQKMLGYFKHDLSKREKQSALDMLSNYASGKESLEAALLFLEELTRKFQKTYLVRQTYFLLYARVGVTESDSC